MRRKKRRNGGVLIDLTSLLDVIFIILLVFLCYASSLNASSKEKIDNAAREQEEVEAEKKVYKQMISEQEELSQYVGYIVINIPPNKDDYTKRTILVLKNGEQELWKDFLEGSYNSEEIYSKLKRYLENYIKDYEDRPVVISVNDKDSDILYRDEKRVHDLINELECSNIYQK